MHPGKITLCPDWDLCTVDRLGFGKLVRLSIEGADLSAIWDDFMERAADDASGSGMGMDLSVIAQLRSDKDVGLAIQKDMLQLQRVFRIQGGGNAKGLRVLAFATESDIGANTPIDLLLEASDVALAVFYIDPEHGLPDLIPDHDVAIVIAPCTPEAETTLNAVDGVLTAWPRPILNHPGNIRKLRRDNLYQALSDIDALCIPATAHASRKDLAALGAQSLALTSLLPDASYPIIVRPEASHAGVGLSKIDKPEELSHYLDDRQEDTFFISPFIDFSGADGFFRKYRLALIGGRPFAVHMAISDEWKVWYASADMAVNVENRVEEAAFMSFFDTEFAARHGAALTAMASRLGLEYFVIDCAEASDGALLIFEGDNSAIVHDLDPPNVYPYKHAHMQKLFRAFVDMLSSRADPA